MADVRPRILSVDGDASRRASAARVLRDAGFDVEEANDGVDVLERARSQPDLIVLDVMAPGTNAFEVCRRLKNDPALASIPVLQLSKSHAQPLERVTGLDSGADAYLSDPIEPAELVATVNALLRGRRAARVWQTTFDAIRDGVCVTSLDGRIVEHNRALASLLGPDLRGQLYQLRVRDALAVSPPAMLAPERVSSEREVAEISTRDRSYRLSRDPLVDADGTLVGSVNIIADVTESKRGEAAVQFLAEASAQLASTLAYDEILDRIVKLALPILGDEAAIYLRGADGRLVRAALADVDPSRLPQADTYPLDLPENRPWFARVMLEGRMVRVGDGVVVPLQARDGILGTLHLLTRRRRYDAVDLWIIDGFARASASALSNARVHAAVLDAERRAEEARAILDLLMERAPMGIAVYDRQLRCVRANASAAALISESSPITQAELADVLTRGTAVTRELSAPAKGSGELRHWLVGYVPLARTGGEVFGVGVITADLTERHRMEDRLRFLLEASRVLSSSLEWEETLAAVARLCVPHVADWCSVDLLEDGKINRLAVAHVDPKKLALGDEYHRRYPPRSDDSTGIAAVLRTGRSEWAPEIPWELVQQQVRDEEQLRIIRELGIVSYMIVPLVARGVTIGAISFVTSESQRRYTPADLAFAEELARRAALAVENARLYQQAQQAIRAREDVLAFVSHDLKNPLTSVVMNAKLLERAAPMGAVGEKLIRHGEMIVRAAERMNRLVHDLLDWASLRAGKLTLDTTTIEVGALLSETVTLLQPVATLKKQTLTCESAPGLMVRADRDRLSRVLSNLIGNALKFTPSEGTIRASAELRGVEVIFAVRDTGPGIAPEELPHVFDRYFRTRTTSAEGTGLGLAIAKGIVEAHGGRIWAESTVGRGSTFFFSLPRMEPETKQERAREDSNLRPTA